MTPRAAGDIVGFWTIVDINMDIEMPFLCVCGCGEQELMSKQELIDIESDCDLRCEHAEETDDD